MKYQGRIFDFYLDASIHVAVAVFCLMQLTAIFEEVPGFDHLAFFVFFGTISCYNFIKYGVEAEKYLLVQNRYHRYIQIFSFISLAIALYHAYFLMLATWFWIAVLILLAGWYSLPIFPPGKKLRNSGLLKILLVALVWAGTTVVLPVVDTKTNFSADIGIELGQRFLLIILLLIPFEIRDLKYDSSALRTLPQRLGVERTKSVGILGCFIFFGLTFLKNSVQLPELLSKGILCILLLIVMGMVKKRQSKYFASFWVEALPVLWYLIARMLTADS